MDFATARKRVGLTQQMLAEKIGMSDGSVASWEIGYSKPGARVIPKLAEAYGLTADEVLALTPATRTSSQEETT